MTVQSDFGELQEVSLADTIKDCRIQVHVPHSSSGRDGFSERMRLVHLLEQQYQRTWSLEAVEERLELCRESLLLLLKAVHDDDEDPSLFISCMSIPSSIYPETMLTEL